MTSQLHGTPLVQAHQDIPQSRGRCRWRVRLSLFAAGAPSYAPISVRRPLLFRATSLAPARAFRVPHPHTNALAADAFRNGLIRSATDYSVYTAGNGSAGTGLEGLDYAFYKGRSKYHTKWDALPHTMGGKRALWAMMEGARGTAEKLLNGKESSGRGDAAVYFDRKSHLILGLPRNLQDVTSARKSTRCFPAQLALHS
jgi:hypothetical protein